MVIVNIIMLLLAVVVCCICVAINLYSNSRRERETQFHELWFVTAKNNSAASRNAATQFDFEA
ncbi:hypothetical protein ACXJY6_12695 [Vibrio sp. RC27]